MKKVFSLERLPPNWKAAELGNVVEFVGGSQPPKETFQSEPYEGGVRLVQIRDFRTDKFPTFIPKNLARRHFDETDVMIGRYGPPVFQILRGLSGSYNVALMKASPKAEMSKDYLFHLLQEPRLHHHVVANSERTAGQSGVNLKLLEAIKIPLPPLAEQRRIAEVLDRAEALRAKRRAALAQLDSLTQSLFLDLFGDPATNPKGWPKRSLGDVAREKPNNGIFRKNPEYIQDGKDGLPVVWLEEIFRGDSIDTKESRRVVPDGADVEKYGLKTGDLLFCRSSLKLDGIAFNNVYLGKDDEALFECHVIRISPDLKIISPVFLNSLLRLPQMRAIAKSKSKTATMTTIDQQSLCSIELPLPPVKLQHEFAGRIRAVEKLKVAHRASLAELDALFATLQNRAFKGEL